MCQLSGFSVKLINGEKVIRGSILDIFVPLIRCFFFFFNLKLYISRELYCCCITKFIQLCCKLQWWGSSLVVDQLNEPGQLNLVFLIAFFFFTYFSLKGCISPTAFHARVLTLDHLTVTGLKPFWTNFVNLCLISYCKISHDLGRKVLVEDDSQPLPHYTLA